MGRPVIWTHVDRAKIVEAVSTESTCMFVGSAGDSGTTFRHSSQASMDLNQANIEITVGL